MIDHDGQAYASPTYLLTSIADFLRSTNYRMLADGMLLQDIRAAEEGITDWRDWCAFFIGLARAHEQLASQSLVNGRALTASEHLVRGSLCAHSWQRSASISACFHRFWAANVASTRRARHMPRRP